MHNDKDSRLTRRELGYVMRLGDSLAYRRCVPLSPLQPSA